MLRKLLLLTFIVFLGIGFFKYADAHVTLNPNESEPESYDKYDVRAVSYTHLTLPTKA